MAFPNLTIIMAHIGHPWQIDCIVVIRKHPNVWADVSGSVLPPVGPLQRHARGDRMGRAGQTALRLRLPRLHAHETMERLRDVNGVIRGTALPPVPEDKIEEIIHRDSLALLGLED